MFFVATIFRLGPPDFYPQTPNCPEEALSKEVLQSGYRETVDGLEVCNLVNNFIIPPVFNIHKSSGFFSFTFHLFHPVQAF